MTVLAADPQNPRTIYAGTLDGGIWKTTDGAAHWSPASDGLKRVSGGFVAIDSIVVDPVVSTRVYALPFIGLYKSDDGGRNWATIGAGVLDGLEVLAVAIDPKASSTIYAGTSRGVYVSRDAGVTWTPSNSGLVAAGAGGASKAGVQLNPPSVSAVAVSPQDSASVMVGTQGAGTFASGDGGATWTKCGGNSVDDLDAGKFDLIPGLAPGVYEFTPEAGLYDLVPGPGLRLEEWLLGHWEKLEGDARDICFDSPCEEDAEILLLPPAPLSTESFHPFASGPAFEIIVATSGRGVYHSLDGGGTFTPINDGLPSLAVASIIGDSATLTRWAGSGVAGVARTTDDAHWTIANTGLFAAEVYALAAANSSPATVYAATESQVLKSANAGVSWQNLPAIGFDQQVWPALAVDPTNSSIVYAATDEKGVIKSTDGGASWHATNSGIPTTAIEAFAIVPSSPQTVYAGTDGGIFKSADGGAHWTLANPDTPMPTVRSLAIDPASVQTLFAGTDRGVFRSTDGGAHWSGVSGANPFLAIAQVHGIGVDPTAHTHVYLATSRGFWKSDDGGTTWTESDAGLPSTAGQPNVPAVAIEPGSPSKIDVASMGFVTGEGDGVYRSSDGGTTWTALDAGLAHGGVDALAVSSGSSPILYAGTVGGGVFRSPAAEPPPPPGKRRVIPVHPAPPARVSKP